MLNVAGQSVRGFCYGVTLFFALELGTAGDGCARIA